MESRCLRRLLIILSVGTGGGSMSVGSGVSDAICTRIGWLLLLS